MRGPGDIGDIDDMTGLDPIDVKILSSLRAIPDEPAPSVAGEVMARLAAGRRRLVVLRWATAVGAAFAAGLGLNALGPGTWSYMFDLLLRAKEGTGGLAVLAKVAAVLRDVLGMIGLKFVQGAIGNDLSAYATEIWASALGAIVVVVLMMYLMGRWLSKPKEGKSWLLRRSIHSGMQVW